MEVLKETIELIVYGAQRIDVDLVNALLLLYIITVPALFLVRIFKGVKG